MRIEGIRVRALIPKDDSQPVVAFEMLLEDGSEHQAEMDLDSAITISASIISEVHLADICSSLIISLKASDTVDEEIQSILNNLMATRILQSDFDRVVRVVKIEDSPQN